MIRVFIIENQQLMQEGLELLINNEKDMYVTGVASHTEQAYKAIQKTKADVVLMDVDHEKYFAIEAALKMKEMNKNLKVIMLASDLKNGSLALKAISFGCEGYLLKVLDSDLVLRSIRDAYNEEIVIAGEVAKHIANNLLKVRYNEKDILKFKLESKSIDLSRRENDVAFLLMKGKENEEIAKSLGLSLGTVKNYVSSIYQKLNISRREGAKGYLERLLK